MGGNRCAAVRQSLSPRVLDSVPLCVGGSNGKALVGWCAMPLSGSDGALANPLIGWPIVIKPLYREV